MPKMDATYRPEKPAKRKRRPNAAQKRALKTAELAVFVKKAGRKAQKRTEPNDRRYDTGVLRSLRQVRAEHLDRLLREDED